jgi:hypothetical protein
VGQILDLLHFRLRETQKAQTQTPFFNPGGQVLDLFAFRLRETQKAQAQTRCGFVTSNFSTP